MTGNMMQPADGNNLPASTVEQMGAVIVQQQQLMQRMADALASMNQRMGQLERQLRQLTPITSTQEKALGDKIKFRAQELQKSYNLPGKAVSLIANAIRKDIKLEGGVRAIRELPRVEYPVYVDRIALWDDYAAMRAIKKTSKEG
jgi:uncharacterized coiled-coil protein SlyX